MISEEVKDKIKNLYTQKKYEEVIEVSEKFTLSEERPSGLINLIGTSYYLKKNPTKEDFKLALSSFESAYLKEKNSIHGLNAIKNLVIVGIKTSNVFREHVKFLHKAKNYYLEASINFQNNKEFLQTGILLFTYLLDKKKIREIIVSIVNGSVVSKDLKGQSTFMINYYDEWSQKEIIDISRQNTQYFSKLDTKELTKTEYLNDSIVNIGFVSCDLVKNHSVLYFLKDTIKYLDKSKFRIFIFSINKKDTNDLSQNELREFSDEWYDLQDFNNQQIVDIIQEKNVDILFDLIGYTNSKRLEIFNSRVAPIQVSWLAYCNTSGFDTVDYLLTDKNSIYKNEHDLYSEKIIYLPNIWNAHCGFKYQRKFNELNATNIKEFTFGSFNTFMKISDETINVWSNILKDVENSRLILKSSNFCSEDLLIHKFKSNGVSDQVIIYSKFDFLKHEDHLNLYKKIDLCLDTFPYNGVTTTFEALWMNVPVIVLKGNNFISRCGVSIIKNSKQDYLIANDKKEYVSKAVFLARNLSQLDIIRKNLYDNILSTDLFNTKKFSRDFNDTLLKIIDYKK
jgi:protein O-GlcNAc transferase